MSRHTVKTRAAFVFIGALAACAMTITAMAQQQARDNSAGAPTSGTGTISGTLVTDDASAKPVRRATMRLNGSDVPGARLAVTDDMGRFAFTRLPAGTFSISATKAAFVTAYYGAKRPGHGPGIPLALTEGQKLSIAMKMTPGAVITGIVNDENGHAAAGVSVQAAAIGSTGDAGTTPRSVQTDDRGVYRIFGLPPGRYLISARAQPGFGLGEMRGMSAAEMNWAQQQASGASRSGSAAAVAPPPSRPIGYAQVYFPGVMDAGAAETIALAPGEERSGISFALRFVPTAKLEGTLVNANGQPVPSATMTLLPKPGNLVAADPLLAREMAQGIGLARVTVANGRFTIAGVGPGPYTLSAQVNSATASQPAGVNVAGRGAGPGSGPMTLWGETDVTVNGDDQSGIVVILQPGTTVAGSIVFEASALKPPADMSSIRMPMPAVKSSPGVTTTAPVATVSAAGTFLFPSVMPGSYNVRPIPPAGAGWVLKSVMLNGKDVADVPLEIKPGVNITGAVVTFTDRPTEIAGTLFDASGRPTPEFSIIVFPVDQALWLSTSRRIRPARPASNGTFSIVGLPAGDYYIAAVTDFEPADVYDQAFLAQLQAASFKVTLADGEKKKQDMKVG